MEDFLRLNLNSFINAIPIITITIILMVVVIFMAPRGMKAISAGVVLIVGAICAFFLFIHFARQSSVNILPKSVIDRDHTEQTQSNYQQRVLKNAAKDTVK